MPFQQRLQHFIQNDKFPILLLLTIILITGLLTFQDYGLSWDEPLYYDYGKASQYAYSIPARLEGTFDLEKSFGASPGDHVTRGPAYLLIGGLLEGILENWGLDLASAWHLTNFLAYILGLSVFYLFLRMWLEPIPATFSTAFFATQPVLWNHAFINPKDNPFSVLFLISMLLGFRMIDRWQDDKKVILKSSILPGIFLGITTSIRFIAPYAVILLLIYFLVTKKWKYIWGFFPYGIIAILVMIAFWPYLWDNPIEKFKIAYLATAYRSANMQVLFMGDEYWAYALPRRYYPTLFAITLTEPTWLLFATGLLAAFVRYLKQKKELAKLVTVLLWFGIAVASLVVLNPPNADGYRHYLFIVPPIFIFAAFGINEILKRLHSRWLKFAAFVILLLPAIYNNITLHPYQYAYYNSFVGGTGKAARSFETDYWLTCYKEAIEKLVPFADEPINLFVKREFYVAAYYAPENIKVLDYEIRLVQPGDYLLLTSRSNPALQRFSDINPYFLRVERNGAIFCEIRKE